MYSFASLCESTFLGTPESGQYFSPRVSRQHTPRRLAAPEKSSQEIIRLEKSKHALEGKMGICQHLVKPQAMCSSNKCISVEGDKEVY